MSKSLDIARYPAAYLDLANRFEAGRKEQWYVTKDERAALAARLDLYGFQRALKCAMPADYPSFTIARLFIASKPWRVRVVHPDDTAPKPAKRK